MKDPYTEGGSDFTVTPSDGLAVCEDRSQAFTGARAGQPLSHEINEGRGADTVVDVEGNIADGVSASHQRAARSENLACSESLRRRTWRPRVRPAARSTVGTPREGRSRTPGMYVAGRRIGS